MVFGFYKLTPREKRVYFLIVIQGVTNQVIASKLGISEETVKAHVGKVFDKTGMGTRLELAISYYRDKLKEKDKIIEIYSANEITKEEEVL